MVTWGETCSPRKSDDERGEEEEPPQGLKHPGGCGYRWEKRTLEGASLSAPIGEGEHQGREAKEDADHSGKGEKGLV